MRQGGAAAPPTASKEPLVLPFLRCSSRATPFTACREGFITALCIRPLSHSAQLPRPRPSCNPPLAAAYHAAYAAR